MKLSREIGISHNQASSIRPGGSTNFLRPDFILLTPALRKDIDERGKKLFDKILGKNK